MGMDGPLRPDDENALQDHADTILLGKDQILNLIFFKPLLWISKQISDVKEMIVKSLPDLLKEMEPSLRTLCLIALLAKEKTLEGSDLEKIPDSILREIRNLSEPNDISKPDNFPERHMGWANSKCVSFRAF